MDNFAQFSLTEATVYRFAPGPRRLKESLPSQDSADESESGRLVRNRPLKERASSITDKDKVTKGPQGPPIPSRSVIWDKLPAFFTDNPVNIPPIVHHGSVAIFENGTRLKWYQSLDLARLCNREKGEMVCDGNVYNNTGFILGYEMGYGKTPTALALICCNPAKPNRTESRSTLVLCPNQGIMKHWSSEAKKFAPKLKVCYYDSISTTFDEKADIILATFSQLRNQHRIVSKDPSHKAKTPLYNRRFYRVIVDEAHFGRDPFTKLAAALWALQKDHGLCLSGTPAQNSPFDLFTLLVFLNVTYLEINRLDIFQRRIYSRRQKGPIKDPGARKTLDTIMKDFCIVRDKINPETGRPIISLPSKTEKLVSITLTHHERLVYEHVRAMSFSCYLSKLMRLRQACDHAVLLTEALSIESPVTEEDTTADLHPKLEDGRSSKAISIRSLPPDLHSSRRLFKDTYLSSKLSAALTILKNRTPGEKTIIFIHFTSLIPSLTNALLNARLSWAEYTGDMTAKERNASLDQISQDKECTVMIVSITAGGVGLNITACSSVIFMEPWWNPYLEEQAICRVYRIGQMNPVTVHRLVVRDSVEEAIVKTQSLKRETMGQLYSGCSVPDSVTVQRWLTE